MVFFPFYRVYMTGTSALISLLLSSLIAVTPLVPGTLFRPAFLLHIAPKTSAQLPLTPVSSPHLVSRP